MKVNPKYLFFIWIGLYFIFLILNLDRIPVAWTDEAQLLDPAARYIFNGKFNTTLYAFETSTQVYASSLPFIQLVHLLVLKFVGTDVFWIRLPMAIAAFASVFLLYKILKNYKYQPLLLLIIPALFLHDKTVYEMIRAGRMEIFTALFFLLSFHWLSQRKFFLSTISTSLLILTHPAAWSAGLVIFLFGWFKTKNTQDKIVLPLLVLLPSVIWLWFIGFDLTALQDQLIGQGKDHGTDLSPGNYLTNNLWYRFWPYWKEQPYMILLHLWAIGFSIFEILKNRKLNNLILELCFLSTEVFMALMLATHHRYNVLLVLLITMLLAKALNRSYYRIRDKKLKFCFAILLPFILFPFISRNAIGLAERRERDPKEVLKWIENTIPIEDKTLLTGSNILHYFAIEKPPFTFFEKIYPQQIKFDQFDHYYLLAAESPHQDAVPISTYLVERNFWSTKISEYVNTKNYNGLVLYKIPNTKAIKEITKPYNHAD